MLKHYRDQATESSKPKAVYINHPRKATPTQEVLLVDGKGDKHTVDCFCNLVPMEHIMGKVGQEIQNAYGKLKIKTDRQRQRQRQREISIYLFMDNTGGHGTKETTEAYIALKENPILCVCFSVVVCQ